MRLLLDTQIIVWLLTDPDKLPLATQLALQDRAYQQWFSSASLWELAIKQRLGRSNIRVDVQDVHQALLASRVEELPVTAAHALKTLDLPMLHRDPFDRIPVAQALCENLTLVTADALIPRYPVAVWKV